MAARQDPYATLKVTPDADDEVIKAAYKALMMKHHPDRNPSGPSADAEAKKINEAYAVLGEPSKRRRYDADQDDHRFERARETAGAGPSDQQDLWRFADEVRATYRDHRPEKRRSTQCSWLARLGFRSFGGLSLLACAALVGFVFLHNGLQTGLIARLRDDTPFSFRRMGRLKAVSPERLLDAVEHAIAGGGDRGEAAGGPKVIRIRAAASKEPTVEVFRGGDGLSSAAGAGYSATAFGNGQIYARSQPSDPLAWLKTWARQTFAGSGKTPKS